MSNYSLNLSASLVMLLLIVFSKTSAQSEQSDTIDEENNSSMLFSLDVMSSAIYSGRNYGVEQMGFNPSITYAHKSGLILSIYSYGMEKTDGLITETDFGVSFQFHPLRHFTLSPGYTYLYNRIQSEKVLYNVVNLATGMELKYISLNNYIGFSFGGGRTNWYEELSIAKYISLWYRESLSIAVAPTVVNIMGTRFSQTFIDYDDIEPIVLEETDKFIPMCIDFQLPVTLDCLPFSLTLAPHFDIPLNLIKPAESSLQGNPFYLTGKISYTLSKNKKSN